MYGTPEPALADAYRVTGRQVRLEQRREAFVARREAELTKMLATRPLLACVPALYGQERGAVPVAADMAGWINESSLDPDRTIAECMFSEAARARIVRKYALTRAKLECELLPATYFDEVA
jgi:hypothetical protein